MHRQDEFIRFHRGRAPHGNGLLSHAGEPLADSPLTQQAEHLLFDEAGKKEAVEQLDLPGFRNAAAFNAQLGDVGGRHASNLGFGFPGLRGGAL